MRLGLMTLLSALAACQGKVSVQHLRGDPAQISLQGVDAVVAGDCASLHLKVLGANGYPARSDGALSLTLGGQGSGGFYADASCTQAVTQWTLPAGENSAALYFRGVGRETLNLRAESGSLSTAALSLSVSTRAQGLALGAEASCALLNGGSVWCWGQDLAALPEPVSGLETKVLEVVAGDRHRCALRSDGQVFCWGNNDYGQLGLGHRSTEAAPTWVSALSSVRHLAAGARHTCALLNDGTVKCFGENLLGQLGDGTRVTRLSPTTVSGLSSVKALSLGEAHSCALLESGALRCWGDNRFGQLGDGTLVSSNVPVSVSGLSLSVTALALGGAHTCALYSDATVACWGQNLNGQLGDGTQTQRSAPTLVSGLGQVSALALGFRHSCALLSGGSVKCWGLNSSGQLGEGSTTERDSPTSVSGLTGATGLDAGEDHSCAVLTDGSVSCWGGNAQKQLGEGTTANHSQPVSASFELNTLVLSQNQSAPGVCQALGLHNALRGATAPFPNAVTLTLSRSGGEFYADAACTQVVSSLSATAGASGLTLYYRNAAAGQTTQLGAVAAGYRSLAQDFHTDGTLADYRIEGEKSLSPGQCGAYTVQAVDSNLGLYAVPVSADTVVSLYTRNSDGLTSGSFYSDAACTQGITQVTLTAGTSGKSFYYRNASLLELVDLSADSNGASIGYAPGLTAWPIFFGFSVDVGGASQYGVVINAIDDPTNTACTPYEMDFAALPQATDILVCANDAADCLGTDYGTLYSDAICSTPLSLPLTVGSGQTSVSFYYAHPTLSVPLYVVGYGAKNAAFYGRKLLR